jgi:ribosomal protein S18 acetylase RimI-like enzyme
MSTFTAPEHSFTLRPVTPGDAGAIATIRVEGWQHAYRGQLEDDLLDRMSAERDEPRWRTHLSAPPSGHHGFIAERAGASVGFVTCGPSRDPGEVSDVGEIYAIYVLPAFIRRGMGRALLDRAMDTLRADGFSQALLWVLESHTGAHRFYQTAGWHRDGGRKTDVLDGFTVREVRYRYRFDT